MSRRRRTAVDEADEDDNEHVQANEDNDDDFVEEKATAPPARKRHARQSQDDNDDDDDDDHTRHKNVRLTSPNGHSQRSSSGSPLDVSADLLSQLTSADSLSQSQRSSGEGGARRRLLDPEQSPVERRKLSEVLMGITSAVKRSGRGGESEIDIDHALRLTNTAWQHVAYVKEETLDADALKTITQASLNQIRRLTANKQVDIDGIVRAIRSKFVSDDGEVDWSRIGRLIANPIQRQATIASFMSGPLRAHYVIKERRVRQRAEKEDLSEVRAEHLQSTAEEHHSQTDHRVAAMEVTLKRLRSVDYFQLILNRQSFGQTIENMFDLTFLIKKGVAQIMERESDGLPFVRYNEAASEQANSNESNADSKQYDVSDNDDDNNTNNSLQPSNAKRSHTSSVVAFNHATWKELCDLYATKAQMIAHRSEEKYDDDDGEDANRVDQSDDEEKAVDNADILVADDDADEQELGHRGGGERRSNVRASSAESPAAKRRRTAKSVRTTEKKQRRSRSRRRNDDDDDDDDAHDDDEDNDNDDDDVSNEKAPEHRSARRRNSGAMVLDD